MYVSNRIFNRHILLQIIHKKFDFRIATIAPQQLLLNDCSSTSMDSEDTIVYPHNFKKIKKK